MSFFQHTSKKAALINCGIKILHGPHKLDKWLRWWEGWERWLPRKGAGWVLRETKNNQGQLCKELKRSVFDYDRQSVVDLMQTTQEKIH
jgi:hypothetical protein